MKIAICFFGLPREYVEWKSRFYKFYDGCDISFYAHFWKDPSLNEKDLKSTFNFKNILLEDQKTDFLKLPKDADLTKTTKGIIHTLSPLYSMKRVGDILVEDTEEYDFIILTRTDVGCNHNTKLLDFGLNKDYFYNSYVRGKEWLVDHLDARWMCGNKEKILKLCKIYENLETYIVDDKISLCHHRLFFHALKEYKDLMEMVNVDLSYTNGGWFFMRNGKLTES